MVKSSFRDVNPQFFRMSVTMSAANTFTQGTFPTNVVPHIENGKARVMEILQIFGEQDMDTLAEDGYIIWQIALKSQTGVVEWSNSDCLCRQRIRTQLITSGGIMNPTPKVLDLTDGNGNGVLVAAQNLYPAVLSSGQAGAQGVHIAILYRWKDITIEEYIGIVS